MRLKRNLSVKSVKNVFSLFFKKQRSIKNLEEKYNQKVVQNQGEEKNEEIDQGENEGIPDWTINSNKILAALGVPPDQTSYNQARMTLKKKTNQETQDDKKMTFKREVV